MSKFNILLYNKVELTDGSQGVVRYMGNIMGKKGVFYGIDITKGDAKNDGTFKNIKYFDTKKGTKTGRFCKENKIKRCKKTTFSKYPFKMGETVMCTKTKCKGIIRYIGVPSWATGGRVYYGLELSKRKGTSNGTVQGVQYFECKTKYGIYTPSKEVKKVGDKNKKNDEEKEEEDVREHIKGYYRSKSGNNLLKLPDTLKEPKKKKKKKKKVKKQPPTEPSYLKDKKRRGSLEVEPALTPQPPMPEKPRGSIDYMDEEKDGIDLARYTAKTEQMDFDNKNKQRREQIQVMKQMERQDKIKREQDKKQKLKEEQQRKEELMYKENEERKEELTKREKELKDKERLEKYALAIQEREDAEKEQQKEKEKMERIKKENEMIKQKQMKEKRDKEELERKEREQERKMAEKLRKEKEAKIKAEKEAKMKADQEEEKKEQNVISNGSGGSIKDRMAMFQKQSNTAPKQKPITPKSATNNSVKKQQYTAPKSSGVGVGVPVGADKAINFEMTEAFGKPLKSIKKTNVPGYKGEIPLVLYLLGQKLVKLDKFGTFKIFHPEMMEKESDKKEMQIAHNIFTFFADLPSPLLNTVPQSVLDKALSKDVMKDVINLIDEPFASTLCYLWDILAKVAMNPNARMSQQSLGKVFGPMCTLVTQQDVKGNRVSMNALAASRMMAFFRRGIEWRMQEQGFDFEESDDDDDD